MTADSSTTRTHPRAADRVEANRRHSDELPTIRPNLTIIDEEMGLQPRSICCYKYLLICSEIT